MEIEFELTGLKLKIKDDKESGGSTQMADLQRQMQGIMNTIAGITQGASAPATPDQSQLKAAPVLIEAAAVNGKKGGLRKGTPRASPSVALNPKHDPEVLGFPKQSWNTVQKAMWLLYVLLQDGTPECSAGVLAVTFNKHFRTFGAIKSQNLVRDLGREKAKTNWVNSDATKDPQTWHLLEAGKKGIAALIQQSKGGSPE